MPEQKIKCPLCFRELIVQTEWAGRIIQCPLCQGTIRLPEFQDSPAAPSYLPPAEMNCGDQTEYDAAPDGDEEETLIQSLAAIASGVDWIFYLVGIILLFTISDWGAGLIIVGIILSFFGFFFKKRVKFVLEPGEKMILTCRLRVINSDNTYFARITDRRVVLCAVEYPFLPVALAVLVEFFSRPKTIARVWNIEDIRSVEIQKSFMSKNMVIKTTTLRLVCRYNKMFVKWWESDEKDNAQAFNNSYITSFMTIAAAIIIGIVIFILVRN